MTFPTVQIDTYHELNSIFQGYSATAHQDKVSIERQIMCTQKIQKASIISATLTNMK